MSFTDDIRAASVIIIAKADAIDALPPAGGSGPLTWPAASNLIGGTQPTPPVLVAGDTDSGAVNLTYYDRLCDSMPGGAVMFLGHSQVQGMPVCAASPFGINLGYGGQSTRRLLHHMTRPSYRAAMQRAGAGVILSGCVDAGNTGYYGSYAAAVPTIVGMFAGQIKNWITGKWVVVLPIRGDQRVSGFPSDYNVAMDGIGVGIVATFASRPNVAILNANPALIDASGNLATANHIGDGQHLSKSGNASLCGVIRAARAGLGVSGMG